MADDVGKLAAKLGMDATEFKAGIATINREVRVMKSEFEATNATLGPLASSMDGLRQKSDILSKQIELQRDKVAKLNDLYQKAKESKDVEAKALDNLKIQVNKATTELGKMENAIRQNQGEMDKLSQKTRVTKEDLEKLSSTFTKVGKGLESAGKTLSIAVTAPLALLGKASIDAAQNAVESESMFRVSLGGMESQARQFSEGMAKSMGLNQYAVRNNIAVLYDMSKALGATSTDAYKVSTDVTKLAYDLASFKNLKPEEAFQKLQAGLSGEAEPLKRLGYVINETTTKAYAYKNGIAELGAELTESEKVMARYGLIMEQTATAQGDLARTIDSPANKARMAAERFAELRVEIGEKLIPIKTKLLEIGGRLMDWFTNLNDAQRSTVMLLAGVAAGVGPVLIGFGKISQAIGSITSAFKLIAPAANAASSATGAAASGLAAVGAGPILIGLAAVAAVITVIALAAGDMKRRVREATEELTAGIQEEAEAAKQATADKYQARIDALQGELSAEEKAYADRIKRIEEETDLAIENAKKAEKAAKDAIKERQQALNDEYRDNIARIRDEYGFVEKTLKSKTDLVRDQYDQEIKLATEAYNAKIKLLDEEYAAKLKALDEETSSLIQTLLDQISAIDAKTREEERLEKEKRDQEKILRLESQIATEDDADKKKALQEELQSFLLEKEREKLLAEREAQKEAIRAQIDEAKAASEEKKATLKAELDAAKEKLAEALENEKLALAAKRDVAIAIIQEERIAKETAETEKYMAAKTALENELTALEGKEGQAEKLIQQGVAAKKRAEDDKLAAVRARVDSEIAEITRLKDAEIKAIEEETTAKVKAAEEQARAKILAENSGNAKSGTYDPNKTASENVAAQTNYATGGYFGSVGPGIPAKAVGDSNWRGGLVQVHERGGEILDLPRGTRIIPNDISREIAREIGRSIAGRAVTFNNNFQSPRALDEAEINRIMRRESQQLQLMYAAER